MVSCRNGWFRGSSKIKQGKNAKQYKVLMLTGRKSKNEIERALKLGADDYVTKPFNVSELQVKN